MVGFVSLVMVFDLEAKNGSTGELKRRENMKKDASGSSVMIDYLDAMDV